ncbi:hypothetical protein ACWFQ8_12195 [Streptomyces sp. NPDC055254]
MPTKPNEDEGDKDSFKVTEQVLLDFANKFETLLKDFAANPAVLTLPQWANGQSSGDDGLLKPGNTNQLVSAKQVQDAFKTLCGQLQSALNVFSAAADSSFLTLKSIKVILDNASDDAISVTEMWEILNSIQQGSKPSGTGSPSPSPTN